MNGYETLLVRIENKTAFITINRESKLNALNSQTLRELSAVLDELLSKKEIRGLVLTGAGSKAFVAGADILEFKDLSSADASEMARIGQENVMNKIAHFPKPIIAAVNGFALGGGLEIAMACHIRVASTNAKLGLPEVSLGIIPGYGGTQRLTQLVGRGKAMEMIMTAEMISAEDALNWGLVNHVVDQDLLLAKCITLLEQIYSRSASAISYAIRAVNKGLEDATSGFETEIKLFGESFGSPESKEGIQAFVEKRKPNF